MLFKDFSPISSGTDTRVWKTTKRYENYHKANELYEQGMTINEIASMLKLTSDTVYKHLKDNKIYHSKKSRKTNIKPINVCYDDGYVKRYDSIKAFAEEIDVSAGVISYFIKYGRSRLLREININKICVIE